MKITFIKKLRARNASYLSVQNLLFYHLLSKNVKIKIYKIVILPVALYGSLTLRVEQVSEANVWT
jgi:hypothetical protein